MYILGVDSVRVLGFRFYILTKETKKTYGYLGQERHIHTPFTQRLTSVSYTHLTLPTTPYV